MKYFKAHKGHLSASSKCVDSATNTDPKQNHGTKQNSFASKLTEDTSPQSRHLKYKLPYKKVQIPYSLEYITSLFTLFALLCCTCKTW